MATRMPVVGYGATAMNFRVGGDAERTVAAAVRLATAALTGFAATTMMERAAGNGQRRSVTRETR